MPTAEKIKVAEAETSVAQNRRGFWGELAIYTLNLFWRVPLAFAALGVTIGLQIISTSIHLLATLFTFKNSFALSKTEDGFNDIENSVTWPIVAFFRSWVLHILATDAAPSSASLNAAKVELKSLREQQKNMMVLNKQFWRMLFPKKLLNKHKQIKVIG